MFPAATIGKHFLFFRPINRSSRAQNLMTAYHQIRQCCSDEGVVMPAGQCPAEAPEDIQKETFFTPEEIQDIEQDHLKITGGSSQ